MSGQIQAMHTTTVSAEAQIKSGRVKVIGIASARRSPLLPDVPTLAESGFPGFEAVQWIGLLAPRGTPRDIVDRLNRIINEAIKHPAMVQRFAAQGLTPAGTTPEEFQKVIEAEVKQWKEVAKAASIKPE